MSGAAGSMQASLEKLTICTNSPREQSTASAQSISNDSTVPSTNAASISRDAATKCAATPDPQVDEQVARPARTEDMSTTLTTSEGDRGSRAVPSHEVLSGSLSPGPQASVLPTEQQLVSEPSEPDAGTREAVSPAGVDADEKPPLVPSTTAALPSAASFPAVSPHTVSMTTPPATAASTPSSATGDRPVSSPMSMPSSAALHQPAGVQGTTSLVMQSVPALVPVSTSSSLSPGCAITPTTTALVMSAPTAVAYHQPVIAAADAERMHSTLLQSSTPPASTPAASINPLTAAPQVVSSLPSTIHTPASLTAGSSNTLTAAPQVVSSLPSTVHTSASLTAGSSVGTLKPSIVSQPAVVLPTPQPSLGPSVASAGALRTGPVPVSHGLSATNASNLNYTGGTLSGTPSSTAAASYPLAPATAAGNAVSTAHTSSTDVSYMVFGQHNVTPASYQAPGAQSNSPFGSHTVHAMQNTSTRASQMAIGAQSCTLPSSCPMPASFSTVASGGNLVPASQSVSSAPGGGLPMSAGQGSSNPSSFVGTLRSRSPAPAPLIIPSHTKSYTTSSSPMGSLQCMSQSQSVHVHAGAPASLHAPMSQPHGPLTPSTPMSNLSQPYQISKPFTPAASTVATLPMPKLAPHSSPATPVSKPYPLLSHPIASTPPHVTSTLSSPRVPVFHSAAASPATPAYASPSVTAPTPAKAAQPHQSTVPPTGNPTSTMTNSPAPNLLPVSHTLAPVTPAPVGPRPYQRPNSSAPQWTPTSQPHISAVGGSQEARLPPTVNNNAGQSTSMAPGSGVRPAVSAQMLGGPMSQMGQGYQVSGQYAATSMAETAAAGKLTGPNPANQYTGASRVPLPSQLVGTTTAPKPEGMSPAGQRTGSMTAARPAGATSTAQQPGTSVSAPSFGSSLVGQQSTLSPTAQLAGPAVAVQQAVTNTSMKPTGMNSAAAQAAVSTDGRPTATNSAAEQGPSGTVRQPIGTAAAVTQATAVKQATASPTVQPTGVTPTAQQAGSSSAVQPAGLHMSAQANRSSFSVQPAGRNPATLQAGGSTTVPPVSVSSAMPGQKLPSSYTPAPPVQSNIMPLASGQTPTTTGPVQLNTAGAMLDSGALHRSSQSNTTLRSDNQGTATLEPSPFHVFSLRDRQSAVTQQGPPPSTSHLMPVSRLAGQAGPITQIKSSHSLTSFAPALSAPALPPSSSITAPSLTPVKSENISHTCGSSDSDSDTDPDDDLLECDESLPHAQHGSEDGDNATSPKYGSSGAALQGGDATGAMGNHETESVNERLERRRKSNRESARRMRQARAERMAKLQAELTALRNKKVQLLEQQMELQQDCEVAMQENQDLWQHLTRLKMKSPYPPYGTEEDDGYDARYSPHHVVQGFGAHDRGSNEDDTIAFPGLKRPPPARNYGPPAKRHMSSMSSMEDVPHSFNYPHDRLHRSKSDGVIWSKEGLSHTRQHSQYQGLHGESSLPEQLPPPHTQPLSRSSLSRAQERSNMTAPFSPLSPVPGRRKEYAESSPAPKASFPPKPLFPRRSSPPMLTPESKTTPYSQEYKDPQQGPLGTRPGGQIVHRTLISPKGPPHPTGSLSSPGETTPATPSKPPCASRTPLPPSPFSRSSNPQEITSSPTAPYAGAEPPVVHAAVTPPSRRNSAPMRLKGSVPSGGGNASSSSREVCPPPHPTRTEVPLGSHRPSSSFSHYPPRTPMTTRGQGYGDTAYPVPRARPQALHRSTSVPSLRHAQSDPYVPEVGDGHGQFRPPTARMLEFPPEQYHSVDPEALEPVGYAAPPVRHARSGSFPPPSRDAYYNYPPRSHQGIIHSRSHASLNDYRTMDHSQSPMRYRSSQEATYMEHPPGRRYSYSPYDEAFAALERREREVEHDIRRRLASNPGHNNMDPEGDEDVETTPLDYDSLHGMDPYKEPGYNAGAGIQEAYGGAGAEYRYPDGDYHKPGQYHAQTTDISRPHIDAHVHHASEMNARELHHTNDTQQTGNHPGRPSVNDDYIATPRLQADVNEGHSGHSVGSRDQGVHTTNVFKSAGDPVMDELVGGMPMMTQQVSDSMFGGKDDSVHGINNIFNDMPHVSITGEGSSHGKTQPHLDALKEDGMGPSNQRAGSPVITLPHSDDFLLRSDAPGTMTLPPLHSWEPPRLGGPEGPSEQLPGLSLLHAGSASNNEPGGLLAESASAKAKGATGQAAPSPPGSISVQGLFSTGHYLTGLDDLDMSQCEALLGDGETEVADWQKLLGDDLLDLGT